MRITANTYHAGEYDLRRMRRQELVNLKQALEVYKGPPHWMDSPWTRGMQAQLQAAIDAHDGFYHRDLSDPEESSMTPEDAPDDAEAQPQRA